ncbi:Ribosomal protein L23 [Rickettsiales bacterium Ac37b]|nr:Ribosomal protein L23 [Rickettsiales bacterium Ac37b]
MIKDNIYDIIRSPIITEKSTRATEVENKHSFLVSVGATKYTIKTAIEHLFGINVTKVNIINMSGKRKMFRGKVGKRNDYKKAIISLSSGQNIDISGIEV